MNEEQPRWPWKLIQTFSQGEKVILNFNKPLYKIPLTLTTFKEDLKGHAVEIIVSLSLIIWCVFFGRNIVLCFSHYLRLTRTH